VAKAGWKFTAGSEMAISFSHFNNSYSVPPNVLSEYPRWWNYPEWKKSLVNLLHKFTINQYLTINGNVYYEKYDNILNSYDDKEMFSQEKKYAFSSVYDDYGLGANLIATLNYDWLPETRVGLRLKHDIHGQKTDINEPAEEFEARTISAAAEQETTAFNDRLALYWGAGLDWLAPVYANGGELRDAANALNIQGGAGYDIRENIRISAHIARRNRFPTLKELYAELLGGFVPNPDLSSENTINYELAGTYEYESLLVVGALFFNDINNLIAVDYLPENVRSFRNIGSADYRGFELSADFDYKGISLSSNYTYIFSENTSESAQSSIIEHIPRHNLNLIAAAESGFGLAIRGEFEFRGHIYSYNTNKRRQQQIDDYGVINLRAEQRIYDELYLFFRVNNIADRYYVTEWGFPSPGRQIIAGTSYNL
jgi:outer membrane receptor protein involved in Fe transport